MIFQVRAARPQLTLNGTDYYNKLAPYFLNMTYTDSCDGQKADDFQLQLADRDRKFINEWMPKPGTFLDVGVYCERWFAPFASALVLNCGRFWIDSVEFELPQHTVSIKAASIPTNVRVKAANDTRGWDKNTLRDIAQQVATESKMELKYADGATNPKYDRVEQTEESALAFLQKRCHDAKLCIKVSNNTIYIFDEQKAEEAAPAFTLVYGDGSAPSPIGAFGGLLSGASDVTGALSGGGKVFRLAGAVFTLMVNDTAKTANVRYTKPGTGDTTLETFTDTGSPSRGGLISGGGGASQPITGVSVPSSESADEGTGDPEDVDTNYNENPGTEDQDEGSSGDGAPTTRVDEGLGSTWNKEDMEGQLAKAKLRSKNKDKIHAKIEMSIGNPLVAAGQTFTMVGVGQFDGKWFAETIDHRVGPEYTTIINARRCLTGY